MALKYRANSPHVERNPQLLQVQFNSLGSGEMRKLPSPSPPPLIYF